jgi:mono/diheme cytochrome c family protein
MYRAACALALGCLALPPHAAAADPKLADKALQVLRQRCSACHGGDGNAKGGFGFVLDRDRLISRAKVVPGHAADSELFQRVRDGDMPPKKPLGDDERAVLRDWIDAGAPSFGGTVVAAAPSPAEVQRLVLADLRALGPRQRRFARYLSLSHLAAAGVSAEDLDRHRHALAKLVNSLSWHPHLTRPTPLDPGATVFRVDLRDYKWAARSWDRLAATYPYRLGEDGEAARVAAELTACDHPLLRADWFVATASRPPFYQDFLQMPNSDRSLERLLQVDVLQDIADDNVVRAGFNGSGVSRNNRVIERHDAAFGAYWRSYDFRDNFDRENVFQRPLGPSPGPASFVHAGGEIIFNLPNGLQGYMLVDGDGRRIDKGPGDVVSDPKRPDRLVETGVSCMSCHSKGLLPKDDQVRAHVQKSPEAFTPADRAAILAIYPPAARMRVLMARDMERFAAALKGLGVPMTDPEPVESVVLRHEAVLDLATAAGEIGLSGEELTKRLRQSPALQGKLGALLARGGTVQRSLFQETFPEVVRVFGLERGADAGNGGAKAVVTSAALERVKGAVSAVAYAPDGRSFVLAEGRVLRLYDATGPRELLTLEGHTDDVLCVARSADNRLIVSGGRDRTVRVWEAATGKELKRLPGHTDAVRCVAVSADGTRALTGGADRVLRLWDLQAGKELVAWAAGAGPVLSVALSADGKVALSGGMDRTVRLWEAATGKDLGRWAGHTGGVYAVALSPDGKKALSGGDDGTVRLWDVAAGKEERRFAGDGNTVVRVAFTPDGKHALAGCTQYRTAGRVVRVWDVAAGAERQGLTWDVEARVEAAAFSPDGRQVLLGLGDGVKLLPVGAYE